MAQESRLVVVIDSQNAVRNAKALADEMSKITEKGDSATRTPKNWAIKSTSQIILFKNLIPRLTILRLW